MSALSKRNKLIVAAIVLIAVISVGGYFAIQQPTTTTTTGTTSAPGLAVPNTDTLIEESAREAGPGGYDPAYTWDNGGNNVFSNVYEQLIKTDGTNMSAFVPWLATSMPDVSPDGLVYTFHLRQGITFQDGTPFNATAVKFNIDRDILINHPDGPEYLIAAQETMAIKGGPRYFSAETVHNYNESEVKAYLAAGGVTIIDPYTVSITLEHPYAAALNQFAFTSSGVSFASPSWIIQHCNGTALTPGVTPGFECEYTVTNPPPGTGPFTVTQITPKVQVVMQRYDNYWGGPDHTGPAKLKYVIYKYVPEVGTRELDLFAGTADAIQLPATNAFDIINKNAWLNNRQIVPLKPGIKVWTAHTLQIFEATLNPRIKPLDDVRFRQALAYAFPYDLYINSAMNGFGTRLGGIIPQGMLGYQPDLLNYYTYNPDKAKALFQEVGYSGTLDLVIATGYPTEEALALLLKDSLANITSNINVQITEVDEPTYLTRYHEFNVPISTGGWLQDIDDPAPFVANFATYAGFRALNALFGGNNQTIINMVNNASASLNPATRIALYREIQLEMLRKAAYLDIAQPIALYAERDWVNPTDSCTGRSVCYALSGDGDGGVTGGYMYAYYVWKANTTPQINVDLQPVVANTTPQINVDLQPVVGLAIKHTVSADILPTRWLSSVSRFT